MNDWPVVSNPMVRFEELIVEHGPEPEPEPDPESEVKKLIPYVKQYTTPPSDLEECHYIDRGIHFKPDLDIFAPALSIPLNGWFAEVTATEILSAKRGEDLSINEVVVAKTDAPFSFKLSFKLDVTDDKRSWLVAEKPIELLNCYYISHPSTLKHLYLRNSRYPGSAIVLVCGSVNSRAHVKCQNLLYNNESVTFMPSVFAFTHLAIESVVKALRNGEVYFVPL